MELISTIHVQYRELPRERDNAFARFYKRKVAASTWMLVPRNGSGILGYPPVLTLSSHGTDLEEVGNTILWKLELS